MTVLNRKKELLERAERLRTAAKMQDPAAQSAIQFIELQIEDAKESLVAADGNDMLRLQGAVRHLEKMLKELTVTPPNIKPEQ